MMRRSVVFYGDSWLGEVDIRIKNSDSGWWSPEIRISRMSPASERCPPLAVLHTVAAAGVCCKLELTPSADETPLVSMHASCIKDSKTAIVPLGEDELHLVAMTSRNNPSKRSCFWGFVVMVGLYNSCLNLLNLRCLGIVFDLDETLIVANTTRSFEDKIDALQRKLNSETDPQRANGMIAEIKRYQDDKSMLKQYIESDQVVDSGKVYKAQAEVVPALSESYQLMTRPVIRLLDKAVILTRINPLIRDTSVLVRLRPAWEDLRSYLTTGSRKRFEVYVCTMAERDYALEMWRLLDPESRLINTAQILDRIVCVKAGSRKSLHNVFQNGACHPRMALVIDDRLRVWDEKDQCRVHVVPPFAPYYDPQAEANNTIPVLCVARNVACNVRGGFFKEFDDNMLPQLGEVLYEDELENFQPSPDVGGYLISEDDNAATNGNRDVLNGMADTDAEKRIKEASYELGANNPLPATFDVKPINLSQPAVPPLGAPLDVSQNASHMVNNIYSQPVGYRPIIQPQPPLQEPILQGSPAREEGEVPESELDPDTRRRLLILQHGQDTRDSTPPFTARPPLQVSAPPVQSHANWLSHEEDMNPRSLNRRLTGFPREPESVAYDKMLPNRKSYFPYGESQLASERFINQNSRFIGQLPNGGDHHGLKYHIPSDYSSYDGGKFVREQIPSAQRNARFETFVGALNDIAMECGSKVEYGLVMCNRDELMFCVEAWFLGEKIGEGIGRTRKEAQCQAAENALRHLSDKFISSDPDKPVGMNDGSSFGYASNMRGFNFPVASTSEESRYVNMQIESSRKATGSVAALHELCMAHGFSMLFHNPTPVDGPASNDFRAQVEIGGQVLGTGHGPTWEDAKSQAASVALENLTSMVGQPTPKRLGSPRSSGPTFSKRFKPDFSRPLRRSPSGRYQG